MKKFNIAWIIVDSVRNYHSSDDRSKLDIMDKFSANCLEFKNVVTSAPSTVMSISSMMTSLPAYFLGRNYTDFRFDDQFFTSFSQLLKKNGWVSRALLMHPEIREKLTVFDLVEKKFWPKQYSHRDYWNNEKIFKLLKNTLEIEGNAKDDKPIFWFLDFNCRNDPKISDTVENSINLLKKYNYNEDNTIFILCSDHGYPDPNTGITPEFLIKEKMTHDMFMTDDNIMIPLILSYPECPKGIKIENLCSSLDIMPTLIDLLGIEVDINIKKKWHGESLINLINKDEKSQNSFKNKKVRVDARFLGQKDRVTAIRSKKNKLVIYHDQKKKELFQIDMNSKKEKKLSINNNKEILESLLSNFNNLEHKALELQTSYIIYKIKDKLNKIKDVKHILIINTEKSDISNVFFKAIKEIFKNNDTKIDLINDDLNNNLVQEKFDLTFILNDKKNDKIKKIMKRLDSKKTFFIDLNMNISIKNTMILRFFKTIYINRKFYIQEPSLIFWKILRSIKSVYKLLLWK